MNFLNGLKFYAISTAIAIGLILLVGGVFAAKDALASPQGWFGLWYTAQQVLAANVGLTNAILGGILAAAVWTGVIIYRHVYPEKYVPTPEEVRAEIRKQLRGGVALPEEMPSSEPSAKEALAEVSRREPVLAH